MKKHTIFLILSVSFAVVVSVLYLAVWHSPVLSQETTTSTYGSGTTSYYTPYIWALNYYPYSSTVTKIDMTSGQILGTYPTGGASNRQVAVDAINNKVWVTNYGSNNVGMLDATTGQLLRTIPIGSSPFGVAIDTNGDVFVACDYACCIWKLEGSTGNTIWQRYVGQWPQAIAVDKDNNVWITTSTEGGRTWKMQGTDGTVLAEYWGGGTNLGIILDLEGNIWRSENHTQTIYKHNSTDWSVLATVSNVKAYFITADQNGNIWAPCWEQNRLVKIRASDGMIVGDYPVSTPSGATVDFDGNIWVTSFETGKIVKFDGVSGAILGTYDAGNSPVSGADSSGIIPQIIMWGGGEIPNSPPTANAGGSYAGLEDSTMTFNASGSSDPDGDSLRYRWDFNNDGLWDTDWAAMPIAAYVWMDDFDGTAKLEVSDGEFTAADTANVTVDNVPPTVTAMNDLTAFCGESVSFTGGFTDPGDDTYTYLWDFGDGNTSNELNTSHIYNSSANYLATLTVSDDDGGVGSDTVEISVTKRETQATLQVQGGQYSDNGTLKAALTSNGNPLFQKTVSFFIDRDHDGIAEALLESKATDTDGTATYTSALQERAGSYVVMVRFEGDGQYNGSSASGNIGISKESATLNYSGDVLVSYGSTAILTATVTEDSDGFSGEIARSGPIEFLLISDLGILRTATADVVEILPGYGIASTTISNLPTDVYKVVVSIGNNDCYSAAETQSILVVFNPNGGFVTGGGWIMKDGKKTNFGFNAKYHADGYLQGEFTLVDKSNETPIQIKSNALNWLVVRNSTSSTFSGICQVNGTNSLDLEVDMHDYNGCGLQDDIAITISDSYSASGPLSGGNIIIHQ